MATQAQSQEEFMRGVERERQLMRREDVQRAEDWDRFKRGAGVFTAGLLIGGVVGYLVGRAVGR